MTCDPNLLEYCETEHQTLVITTILDSGSNEKAAKILNIAKRNVEKAKARVVLAAARRGYAPDYGINKPLPKNLNLAGMSTLVDNDGNAKLTWYKSNKADRAAESVIEALEKFKYKPAPKFKTPKKTCPDLLSLYTLTDFHLGMYAWGKESGDDWDIKIASKVLMNAIHDMINKAPNSAIGILNLQGDFLHWDGLDAVTPMNKHVLEADTRFDMMIELALDLTMWAIEALAKKHKNVKVIVCEGNHDLAGSAWLRKAMKKIYSSHKNIEIDDTVFPYYAHLHGKTMIGFHHGHKMKNKSLPSLFASEPRYREMWGQANYTYIHTGHYHQVEQDMSEHGGAIVERHPTLAARDAYAVRGGYVSRRSTKVITYHTEDGEVDRSTVLPREV